MHRKKTTSSWRWLALLLVAGLTLSVSGRSWAHDCPVGPAVPITFPADGATVSGRIRIFVYPNGLPPGFLHWGRAEMSIVDAGYVYDDPVHVRAFLIQANPTEDGPWWTDFDTTTVPNGDYWLYSTSRLIPDDYPVHPVCDYGSTTHIQIHVGNPNNSHLYPDSSQNCSCRNDCVLTGSSTSPLSGHQSWSVPITSWISHGATYRFGLEYNSHALVEPQNVGTAWEAPNFNGLSERNSHWHQPYAQWVELARNEHGALSAIWRRGGEPLSFPWDTTKSTFTNPDSEYSIASTAGPITKSVTCGGAPGTVSSDYASFTITDRAGTVYTFSTVYWQVPAGSECTALPYYLLTQIADRWGRQLNLTWTDKTVAGVVEKRVTAVKDQDNVGLTLGYDANGLLTSVQDPQGRTHSLAYTGVNDENAHSRQKLTSVTVYGPGAGPGNSNRVRYDWQFGYRLTPGTDPWDDSTAYGGTPTGDLVVKKQEPDGLVTYYQYEGVTSLVPPDGTEQQRPTAEDWEGRVTRISYFDSSEGSSVERYTTRTKDSATQATLTFPGGVTIRYNYTGLDLTSVTRVSGTTTQTWSYTFDTKHNLTSVRTPLEATGAPLAQYDYGFDIYGRIRTVTARYRKDDGTLGSCAIGDATLTQLNALSEPKQVTEIARSGQVLDNHVTAFEYDGGGTLGVGNLTKITQAPGSAVEQVTNLLYGAPDGNWGLPTQVTNEVGAATTFDYDDITGRLLTTTSPINLLVGTGHTDRAGSVTALAYNADGLPSQVTDPMGHVVQVGYAPFFGNNALLVVTTTFNDGSTRQATLDPKGRVLWASDERGIVTEWDYNPAGQVTTIVRDAGNPPASRTTTLSYNDQGDLRWIDPPIGPEGRVQFEYVRYTSAGALVSPTVYEGQVTHVTYADGRQEYFGYNDAGELAWKRKGSGATITITSRDGQHRVTRIDYGPELGSPAFSVTTTYDEFGRVVSTTDPTGTTGVTFDLLDRPVMVTPPSPQKALTYSYTPDLTNQRWSTQVQVAGIGSYQYQDDTKGRLSDLINPFNQTFHLEYDRDGNNTLVAQPNGTREEKMYNGRDWLTSLVLRQANGTPLDTLTYSYTDSLTGLADPTGHLRQETDGGTRVHAFHYNNLYELTQETHPDFGTISYTYDPNGNRTSKTGSVGTNYYGVDGANKLLWVNRGVNTAPTHNQANPYTLFTYDADGRTSFRERQFDGGSHRDFSFTWDADDRLKNVQNGASSWLSATYDGDGTRVSKTDLWTGTHNFSWGPGGVVHDSSGMGTVYTPGFAQRQGSTDRFVQDDWLGSTRYLADSSGNGFQSGLRFDAFGNRTTTGGADPFTSTDFQFAGGAGYQTEYATATEPGVGLQLLGQRYYDPVIGRFLSPDPIGFGAGLNLYRYCNNDPVNRIDPGGMQDGLYDEQVPVGTNPDPTSLQNLLAQQAMDVRHGELAPEVEPPPPLEGTGELTPEMARAATAAEAAEGIARAARLLGAPAPLSGPCDELEPMAPEGEAGNIGPGSGLMLGSRKGVVFFEGREVRAVRSLAHLSDSTLRVMAEEGFSGRDTRGVSLHLHHINQDPNGVLVEIPADMHSIGNEIQHPYGNTPGAGLSPEQRAEFDPFRERYWRARARAEQIRRGQGW